jgi:hypothetical protein
MDTKLRMLGRGIAAVACCGVLFTAGIALAAGNPNNGKGNPHTTTGTTTGQTTTSLPSQAKAYGVYCANQSKVHVDGQKGTPFSQCVTAMAKLHKGTTSSPQVACAALSKKHVSGQKGTPYSNCVAAGAKLLKNHG